MRELSTIDGLAELIHPVGEPVYVRYSQEPEADASESSVDHESGMELPVLSDETAFDAQKFTTRVAGGNLPDVVQMDADLVATYAAQGLIVLLGKRTPAAALKEAQASALRAYQQATK